MSKCAILLKAVDLRNKTRKDIGNLGEDVACEYFRRKGFRVVARNVARKTGEIDVIVKKGDTLHFVEVKSMVRTEFPKEESVSDEYDPSSNLHPYKIKKVARTAEWYVAETDWEGEWQIDGLLVWLRERDGMAQVRYLPQIL